MTTDENGKANALRQIRIHKVTLNIATGKSGEPLEKAKKVLTQLTNHNPATMRAKKAIKDFNVRRGEPIAAVVTLRRDEASLFLVRALDAVGNKLRESSFDERGNVSFGIREHIEIPGTKYVPELGIFGTTVHVTLERPGYRVKRRSIQPARVGRRHNVTRDEAVEFLQSNFRIEVAR